MSLGELWLGFFRYYLFEFDRDVNVVCVRQKQLLPRFVKMWNSLLAIEDPFNLDHNLTGSLSRDSLLSILDVFYAVLKHHTTLLPDSMPSNIWRYLAENRSHGPPPKSRCHRCQECGHRASDCPRNYTRGTNTCGPTTAVSMPVDTSVDVLIGPLLAPKSTGLLNSDTQQQHPYPQQLQQKQNVSDRQLASQQYTCFSPLQQPRTPLFFFFPRLSMVPGPFHPPRPRPHATMVTSNYGHIRDSGRVYCQLSLNPTEVPVQCATAYRTPFYPQTLYDQTPHSQPQTPVDAQEATTVQPGLHKDWTDGPQAGAIPSSAHSPKKDPRTPLSCDNKPFQRDPLRMEAPVKSTTSPSPNIGRDDRPEHGYLARNASEIAPTVSISDTSHDTVRHTASSVSSNQRLSKRKRNRAKPPPEHAVNSPETFDGHTKETNCPIVQPPCPPPNHNGNSRRKKFTRSTAEARSILNNKADIELAMQFQQMATNNIKPDHPGSFSR